MRTILRYIVLINIGQHWNIEKLRNYLDGMTHTGYIPCYNLVINETRIWRHENDITIHLEAPCKELFEI